MMWARFPNGQVVQYNDANYLVYTTNVWELYTQKDGQWICSIPASSGCIIESVKACSVENPIERLNSDSVIEFIVNNKASLKIWQLQQLREIIKSFNFRTYSWKVK